MNERIRIFVQRLARFLSPPGAFIGLLFFAASLTPSLLPRSDLVQGLLSGICAASGYLVGTMLNWLWRYLELPNPSNSKLPILKALLVAAVVFSGAFLWKAVEWQNSIRVLWKMDALDSADPFALAGVALVTSSSCSVLVESSSWQLGDSRRGSASSCHGVFQMFSA